MRHTINIAGTNVETERTLIDQKPGDGGAIYREYLYKVPAYTIGKTFIPADTIRQYFIVNADEASNTTDPYNHEVSVTRDAYVLGKSFANLQASDISLLNAGGLFGRDRDASGLSMEEPDIPNWLITPMRLNNNSIAKNG